MNLLREAPPDSASVRITAPTVCQHFTWDGEVTPEQLALDFVRGYDLGQSECVIFVMAFLGDAGEEENVYCQWTPATGELICDEEPKDTLSMTSLGFS